MQVADSFAIEEISVKNYNNKTREGQSCRTFIPHDPITAPFAITFSAYPLTFCTSA
ncbi:hypothetical protein NTE_01693 [Candidatus Nitrososphaera evergladensis SR1]|uniref:Uncharacterized protein n=1 Tax=Candidatus Nitrososphaera evergladensis SR1 TaxID=1459636 RepID=A0A075MWV9_9ARCH|nr:hypothetical protein [Candidatus Nitrososphaera evergladensis]AIF83754.1 hypothetical protein NTE_01693 [Candidatus Nitrososphaera evergladensis SR1]